MRRTMYLASLTGSLAFAATASAASQDLYNNTTTYLNNGLVNGEATDVGASNLKTLLMADDIIFAPGSAGKPVDGFSFDVRNFGGTNVLARSLVTFYADNGSNAPGALLASFPFFQSTEVAGGHRILSFYPFGGNIFTVPAGGKIWAGIAFDNRMGITGATAAQLDNLGQGAYGPSTVGSSSGDVFYSNAAGDYAVNNPVGHRENPGINLGWRLTTPIPGNVTWNVAGGGAWNFSDNNWAGGSPDPNRYANWDNVTFGNTAGGTITLLTGIGITPSSTTVNASHADGTVASSGTYTFAGAGIATGTLIKKGRNRLVLTNPNTFTGDTTVYNSGTINQNGSTAHLTLANPTGNSLSGDLHIGIADPNATNPPADGVAKVSLAQPNQIADNRVVYFDSAAGRFAYFSLRGNSETIAGIHSTQNGGAIENGNLNGAINANATLTLAPPAATTYTYGGIIRDADSGGGTGKLSLVVNGPGTQVIGSGTYTYTGGTTVNAGTLVAAHANAINTGQALTVNAGGTMRSQAGVATALDVGTLTVAATGKLDLNDGGLVKRNGGSGTTGQTATQQITALLKTGLENAGNFNWLGSGISSTEANADNATAGSVLYGLGVVQNNLAAAGSANGTTTDASPGNEIYTSFKGRTVGLNDTLVRYTYMGDADLSGSVDSTDYSLIDSGFALALGGWLNGDFDYSGVIDATDYALIDNAFAFQTGPLSGELLAMYDLHAAMFGQSYVEAFAAVQAGAVPEPGTLGVLALAGVGILARSRRNRL